MPVSYGDDKLIPAPFATINKVYNKTQDGTIIGSAFQIRIVGQIMAWKGSPNSSKVFWSSSGYPPDETSVMNDADARLEAILRKQEAIRDLFSQEGLHMEITPWNGTAPVKCNPRVISITFPEGLWYEVCPYEIVLEADRLFISGSNVEDVFEVTIDDDGTVKYFIEDASESWSIDFGDASSNAADGIHYVYNLSHTVSAKGKRSYSSVGDGTLAGSSDGSVEDGTPWKQARAYVRSRLGYDISELSNVRSSIKLEEETLSGFNYTVQEQIDELGGSYSVTESWSLATPTQKAIEQFTVSSNLNLDTGKTSVSIQGSIQGLEERSSTNLSISTTKYENANTYFATILPLLFSRAQSAAGISLNPQALATVVGRNKTAGIIEYTAEFDNRASNLVSGALFEEISVQDDFPTDVYASIPIIGRANGPILQRMNTYTSFGRTLSVSLKMGASGVNTFSNPPNVDSIITMVTPSGYSKLLVDQNTQVWDWKNGIYQRTYKWTCGN